MSTESSIRVLLVEDNPGDARLIAESLRSDQSIPGFELRTIDRIAEVRPTLATSPADVLLLDLGLPDAQGLDSFRQLRTIAPGLPIIVLSGLADQDVAVRAVREGAQDYLVKGRFDGDPLPRIVRFAVERRRADEALRRSEARFRAAIEASPDAFAILEAVRDASGRICTFTITDMNKRAERLLGGPLESLVGKPLDVWCPFDPRHDSVATFSRVVETREFLEQEIANEDAATGETTWTLRQIFPLADGVACFVRDITQRRRLQDQLRQKQKMEAIGQLAAGVAHDFQNLLSAMQGHLAQARRSLTENDPARESLEQVQAAVEQAYGVAGSLLRFSIKRSTEKHPVRLATIVEQSVNLLRASLPAGISIETRIDDPNVVVDGDANQLQQVVMNLAINARDAMGQSGTLSLAVTSSPTDPTTAAGPRGVARLTVRDTGSGMSPEVRARIFEPYFTTKPRGQGTGLGLSIIHGIVSEHGGDISVESRPGAGSTFIMTLPAVNAPEAPVAPVRAPHEARLTALIAESNPFVREVLASMLSSMHFEVVQAGDAASAVRLARTARTPFSLVIAAEQLSDGAGSSCLQQIRSLVGSGETRGILVANAPPTNGSAANGRTGVLLHPFRRADLAREIERLRGT